MQRNFSRVYFATIDRAVKPKEWADRMKADVMSNMFDQYSTDDQGNLSSLSGKFPSCCRQFAQQGKFSYDALIKKYGHLFPGRPAPQSYVYRHRRESSQPAILQGAAAFGGYLGRVGVLPQSEKCLILPSCRMEYAARGKMCVS